MLGRDTDDDYLKQVFSPYGTVEEATVLRLPDVTSKGCAFVKFSSNAEAINAIAALHNRVTVEVSALVNAACFLRVLSLGGERGQCASCQMCAVE